MSVLSSLHCLCIAGSLEAPFVLFRRHLLSAAQAVSAASGNVVSWLSGLMSAAFARS